MNNNYRTRLSNVGITTDESGKVTGRPDKNQQKTFKASYKKAEEKLGRDKSQGRSNERNGASQAFLRALGTPDAGPNPIPDFDPAAPIGFVCGIQEPPWLYKKVLGLSGHTMLIDSNCDQPRAAIFHM